LGKKNFPPIEDTTILGLKSKVCFLGNKESKQLKRGFKKSSS
jgi:hypothetical protein